MLAHNHDSPFNQRLEHLPSTMFTKPFSVTIAISHLWSLVVETNLTRLDGNVNVGYIHHAKVNMTTRVVKTGRSLGPIPRRDVPSRKRRMHVD